MSFKSCHNGFWLRFDNGLVLSTQFGYGSFCEGHDLFYEKCVLEKDGFTKFRDSVPNAEIAIGTDSNPCSHTKEAMKAIGIDYADMVAGWVSFSDWLRVVEWCKNWKESHVKPS